MTRLSWRIWRHRATGTEATYVGVERDASGLTYALMTTGDGVTGRIDPLDLLNGSWVADGIHGTPVQLVQSNAERIERLKAELADHAPGRRSRWAVVVWALGFVCMASLPFVIHLMAR